MTTQTTEQTPALDARALRDAFGTYPSGVVAVAGRAQGRLVGIAASSFTSVSIDPPLVSVSVAAESNTWPLLRQSDQIGVSVLAAHHDALCRQLAGPADERFDDLAVHTTRGGAVLLDEAVAHFTCTVHDEVEAGDHVVVLLAIEGVHVEDERQPLVFHRSSFQRLHRDDLDPRRLDGRINGEPVAAETSGGQESAA
ncbi:flavin reductase family protein [Nocardioides acrostichi]|uniref:Flavin reductase family protein n=1 Tax=Nocardioides acrostichi TaxID=2784339 RepID=A0A930USW0_9ACTN|nr:flavin reductase family protein [Nocardioides acrostichi]MBF4160228.1 flavin reductase family protein [Nocardioides acrostichi]